MMTREDWLTALASRMTPHFEHLAGVTPASYRVSCGFMASGARSKHVGECWSPAASADGAREIFITPKWDKARDVAHVLAHELLHACFDHGVGHRRPFAKACEAIGLKKPWTATTPTDAFWVWCGPLLDELGAYPHARLDASQSGKKKQTTRLLKAECETCGYTVRVTKKWIDEAGAPRCAHAEHGPMSCEGVDAGDDEEGEE